MDRRNFLKTSAAAVAVTQARSGAAKAPKKTRKPNVLYVFSDQHRALSLPGEPFNQALAPNIEAFREKNCSMERCVSNFPLCAPYRAIFMSGLYPQQSGVMLNVKKLDPGVGPLGETFRNAGYHTGYIGKWHLAGQISSSRFDEVLVPKGPLRMGFEHWQVWADTDDHYHGFTFNPDTGEKITPDGWGPTCMTDQAIDFFKAQPKDKPWFLVLSWNPPHPPFDPPSADKAPYALDQIKFRPNVHFSQKGGRSSEDSLRTSAQGYMGGITGVDKEFARVLKALDETGHAEDTIVVYTSDHGEMMGSQGLMGKKAPFEESCRVPFIVRYPGVTLDHHKSETLFAAVDIYPTLCGLTGVPVPKHCVGRDLSGVMLGRKVAEPDHVFLMSENARDLQAQGAHQAAPAKEAPKAAPGGRARRAEGGADGGGAEGGEGAGVPSYRGIRTKTHTYAVGLNGRWLLYDNVTDPYQMKNLIDDKAQQPLIESFDAKIEAWLQSVNDPFPYAEAKNMSQHAG